MFKDTQEELQRLQKQLLAEEETKVLPNIDSFLKKQQPQQADDQNKDSLEDIAYLLDMDEEDLEDLLGTKETPEAPTYRNFSNGYGSRPIRAYNADKDDVNIYSDDSEDRDFVREKPQSLRGLIITALSLLAGIGAVLLWWVVRYF